jgi:hypothetical protein
MLIAVINNSTLVSDFEVQLICKACQIQMDLHLAPAWNQKPATITFYADKTKVPGYAWVFNVIDDNSQVPDALAYHDEEADKVMAYTMSKVILDNKGVVLYDDANPQNDTISAAFSHEMCEAFIDRFCNYWILGPQTPYGMFFCLEVSDPVQSASYTIEVDGYKVSVSDFIFPSWSNPMFQAKTNMPLDYCNKLTQPFSMLPGGYMTITDGTNVQQVFGQDMPQWKVEQKKKEVSRAARRMSAPKKV